MLSSTRRLSHRRFLLAVILSFFGSFLSAHKAEAQAPSVVLRITDTVISANSGNVNLSVYIDNYFDEISGFDMRLRIDRTDLITFNSTVDTSGSLISSWEYLLYQLSESPHHELRVTGFADMAAPPITPPFDPQQGGLLFRFSVKGFYPPSSETERDAEIIFVHEEPADLILSTDLGNRTIGIYPTAVFDTLGCYNCTEWFGDLCLGWESADQPPYDSCAVGYVIKQVLDTTEVVLFHGSVSMPHCCVDARGNTNNDPENLSNISDVTYLVSYLFGIPSGPAPVCQEEGNVNGDNLEQVNIADLTYLIAYLFQIPSGPPPPACP